MAFAGLDQFLNSLSDKHEPFVKTHLKNVYSCLSMSTLAAAVGAYIHVATHILEGSFMTTLIGLGLLVALTMTPDNGKNRTMRLGFLLGFSFFSGLGMGPLLSFAIHVDPSIIPTALLSTFVVFICFTASSLYSEQRRYLYLGGILMSGMSLALVLGLLSILFGSVLLSKVHLYLGLALMCGFVMYDTQLIIEKRRRGDQDYIRHSLDLFIDLIGIFRRLVIILTDKEQQKRNRRRSNN